MSEKIEKTYSLRKHFILGLLFVAVIIIGFTSLLAVITRHNREFTVPDFTTLSVSEATQLASKAELRVEVIDSVYVKRIDRGAVFSQNPPAGSKVKKGRRVLLTINSLVPQTTKMPELVGFSLRQARSELSAAGLKLGKITYQSDIATNNVLKQLYRGAPIKPGRTIETESEIDLILGLNEDEGMTYIPYLKGFTSQIAINSLHDNSLNVGRLFYDESVTNYADTLRAVVFRQSPEASEEQTPAGTAVNLYLTINQDKVGGGE